MSLRLSPISEAVALRAGGLWQDRAPGMSEAAMLALHPIAATSRFWYLPRVTFPNVIVSVTITRKAGARRLATAFIDGREVEGECRADGSFSFPGFPVIGFPSEDRNGA